MFEPPGWAELSYLCKRTNWGDIWLASENIPVHGIVDNKGVVDAIHSTAPVVGRKLRRDIGAIKQLLNQREVTGISWCAGKEQLADCMSKRGAAAWTLMEVFQNGIRKK